MNHVMSDIMTRYSSLPRFVKKYVDEIYIYKSIIFPFLLGFFITCIIAWIWDISVINPLFYAILLAIEYFVYKGSYKFAHWVMSEYD